MPDKKSDIDIYQDPSLVEIMDENNRPIAVLSREVAHRQFLRHRSVQVLVFNTEKIIPAKKKQRSKTLS